jgi:lysophospholipase L1-like esterase
MKNKIKYLIFTFITIFFVYCIAETVAFLALKSVTTVTMSEYGVEEKLTKKFPAQLRMTKKEILKEFSKISPIQRAGQFLSFDFDPVMGYRKFDFQRWYGGSKEDAKDKFVILCFGGSTTQLDNWPKYLLKYAKKKGVKEDILVLNAGVAGYTTFNEMLYFSQWILPIFEQLGKKPNLVLSLDGVNDIWYRIFSYVLADREKKAVWYERYHGVHQQYDDDMNKIRTVSGAFRQLCANCLTDIRNLSICIAPYSMRMLEFSIRKILGGRGKKEIRSENTAVNLPGDIEDRIVTAFQGTLTDFFSLANGRNIDFISYLQPVVLPEYFPHKIPDDYLFKGINQMGLKEYRAYRLFTSLTYNRIVKTDRMYAESEKMYSALNMLYPGHFVSLIDLYYNISDVKSLFKNDSIHYNQYGKELLAEAVINDLLKKELLTKISKKNYGDSE